MQWFKRLPVSPLLLSGYLVLALLAYNVDQINSSEAVRALVLSVLGAAFALMLFRLLMGNWHQAALAASTLVLLFFLYGHIYGFLKQFDIQSAVIGRHRYLFPLYIALAAMGIYWIRYRIKDPITYSSFLNLFAAVAILFPIYQISSFLWRVESAASASQLSASNHCELSPPASEPWPDIYFIILDGYGRQDDLMEHYEYDNAEFIANLQEQGFYVAPGSQSNYLFTLLSLASTLNLDYLQNVDERIHAGAPWDPALLFPKVGHSVVREQLACLGYQTVALDTGWYVTGWIDADYYLNAHDSQLDVLEFTGGVNAFESLLIQTSAGIILTDAATVLPDYLQVETNHPFNVHRSRLLFIFDSMENVVPLIEGPKFVFAHILATHRPFVFGPNGAPLESKGTFTFGDPDGAGTEPYHFERYRDALAYTNLRLEKIIEAILRQSETPPIIIIQSDHGFSYEDLRSFRILNAYYFPEAELSWYETISPVNSFRMVFNEYFGGQYPLLEDISYKTTQNTFDFTIFPNDWPAP